MTLRELRLINTTLKDAPQTQILVFYLYLEEKLFNKPDRFFFFLVEMSLKQGKQDINTSHSHGRPPQP